MAVGAVAASPSIKTGFFAVMNTSTRIERARKPKHCPQCGQTPVARILYGMPACDEKLVRNLEESRITLGGCCISFDDPAWECTHCGLKIFRIADAEPPHLRIPQ